MAAEYRHEWAECWCGEVADVLVKPRWPGGVFVLGHEGGVQHAAKVSRCNDEACGCFMFREASLPSEG